MNEPWWKSTTLYAMGGAAIGSVAVVVMSENQLAVADSWSLTVGAVAAGVAALAAAFRAAIGKRR